MEHRNVLKWCLPRVCSNTENADSKKLSEKGSSGIVHSAKSRVDKSQGKEKETQAGGVCTAGGWSLGGEAGEAFLYFCIFQFSFLQSHGWPHVESNPN